MRHLVLAVLLTITACAAPCGLPSPPFDTPGYRISVRVVAEHDSIGHMSRDDAASCLITLNGGALSSEPASVWWWVLMHEYHHCIGINDELEADCAALHSLREARMLPAHAEAEIIAFIQGLQPSAVHPPGSERALHAIECLLREEP